MAWWDRKSPVALARAFVDACNARDGAAVAKIVSDDFVFQDSRGGRIEGRRAMLEALSHVDRLAPDLRVELDSAVRRGDSALLSGRSICSEPGLACDTQWRGFARDGKLVEWHAYGAASQDSLVGLLGSLKDRE